MTTAEVLLQDYDMEMGMTRRTLERVSEDKPDYKPHEKSMAMGRLAMHVATLPRFGTTILTTPSMDLTTAKWPDMIFSTREKLLADFDALTAEARAALASLLRRRPGRHRGSSPSANTSSPTARARSPSGTCSSTTSSTTAHSLASICG
jgi:uncharacterized damage-inducible protein DinB